MINDDDYDDYEDYEDYEDHDYHNDDDKYDNYEDYDFYYNAMSKARSPKLVASPELPSPIANISR